jgi:glycosyltransferase involved in cell wall biosynthesis
MYIEPPDLILVESPPLFLGPAALYLSARLGAPYVFNVSDLWPESAIRLGVVRAGLATRISEMLEYVLYRKAAAVTGQSEEILAFVGERAQGAPRFLVTNGVEPRRFGSDQADTEARAMVGHAPGPIFVYAGLLGLAQGLDQILDLARDLPPDVPGRFVLVGDGPVRDHIAARIDLEGLSARVRLIPPQPRERVPALLACADAAVIPLGMTIVGAVPSKIYEAMAASLPILLVADGEAARRVEEAGAGLTVSPGAANDLREAFTRLAMDAGLRARLGAAGRIAAETTYDRGAIASRLDGFLRSLVVQRPR